MRLLRAVLTILLCGGALAQGAPLAEIPQETPQVKKRVEPRYPEIAKRASIQGEAFIKATIDETGRVAATTILKATREEFGAAALEAVTQWEFIPAMKDGKVIKAEVTIPFRFRLAGDDAYYGLMKVAEGILRGQIGESLRKEIDPEAYAVVGRRYESLYAILFDKSPRMILMEGPEMKIEFSSLKANDAKDAVVLVMKTRVAQDHVEHFHTVVFMKSADGQWKIRSWHASE